MEDNEWNWKSKLIVYGSIIFMLATVLLYVRGCATGELFNSPNPDDPTMRPMGSGQ
jgi:hypothetical protein